MRVYDIKNNFNEVTDQWSPGKNYYWIAADAKEIGEIRTHFSLDDESVEECKNLQQSGKISFFDDYLFIVFNILEYKKDEIISKELNIFLGKDHIITVFKDHCDIIEELIKDVRQCKNCHILKQHPRPYILLYYILDRIIVRNYNIISDVEEYADNIEISILKSPKIEYGRRLINIRRQVHNIRKFLNPLRYIGDSLVINDNNIIEKESMNYFESLNVKIGKLMQSLEVLVQDLALVREAYEAEVANKTNNLMKVFTIVAAVFLPLNLIVGLFSMNLDKMPLKENEYGYYIVLFFLTLVVLYLIHLFRKRRWL
jgi:magnesium transporter